MREIMAMVFVAVVLAGCSENPFANRNQNSGDSEDQLKAAGDVKIVLTGENPDISNTQDFGAVVEKETIASDAAKLAALKETYQVIEPVALPKRSKTVNLAAYAFSQNQPVGVKKYRRSKFKLSGCSRYRKDQDAAQRLFLMTGGPARDRRGLDADGDGFACNWDPNTYRQLLQK